MSITTFQRNASIVEMAVEMDRRGAVIEKLEAENDRLREALKTINRIASPNPQRSFEVAISNLDFITDHARWALTAPSERPANPITKEKGK